MHKVIVILVTTLLTYSLSYCDNIFSWANDLKDKAQGLPVIVANPNGGYTAIWEEIGDRPSEMPGIPPRQYFYRMVDAAGKPVVSDREFEFWRLSTTPNYYAVLFNSKALLWLNADSLLILAWKWFFSGVTIDRVIVNSKGKIAAGPDSAPEAGVGEDAVLVKDHKGRVIAFDYGAGLRAGAAEKCQGA